MRVTEDVKLATERAIRTSARKLFVRKGLEATSTRDIAAAARIAAGTLFNYYPSKEALAASIAAEAFAEGREEAQRRLAEEGRERSLDEDLFTLVAADIRALAPIRSFVREVLEVAMSPFAAGEASPEAREILATRMEDAADVLRRHGLGAAVNGAVLHLYWSLYLGVLSYWAADASPKQEDTWAVLDRGVRMFIGGLRTEGRSDEPSLQPPPSGRGSEAKPTPQLPPSGRGSRKELP